MWSDERPMTDPPIEDPYVVLGVRRGASDKVIAAAYRRLARQNHPDIAGETATVRMAGINAAFDAIRTATRRAAHDDLDPPAATAARRGGADDPGRPRWTPERDGTGGAGPPPGRPSGSVLGFGRHIGWSIGEVARVDPGYLEWLSHRREGRAYIDEIDVTLRRVGFREGPAP
jgi:curved DNA-binding protein CbpA